MTWVLLQTAGSELERTTEVCKYFIMNQRVLLRTTHTLAGTILCGDKECMFNLKKY